MINRSLGIFGASFFLYVSAGFSALSAVQAEDANIQVIERVVNANTAVLKGGRKIRFIGVNAPDMYNADENSKLQIAQDYDEEKLSELGREAKQFVQYLVQGQKVRLELEPEFAAFGHKDREGNVLAYVWFTSPVFPKTPDWLVMDPNIENARHDAFLNAIIVRAGHGEMDRRWPFRYAEKFLSLEQEAQKNNRYIWNSSRLKQPAPAAAEPAAPVKPAA